MRADHEGYCPVPTFRTHGYVELPVGVVLALALMLLVFVSMVGLGVAERAHEPTMYRSAADGRCIRIVQYKGPLLSCEAPPRRFATVVVSDVELARTSN